MQSNLLTRSLQFACVSSLISVCLHTPATFDFFPPLRYLLTPLPLSSNHLFRYLVLFIDISVFLVFLIESLLILLNNLDVSSPFTLSPPLSPPSSSPPSPSIRMAPPFLPVREIASIWGISSLLNDGSARKGWNGEEIGGEGGGEEGANPPISRAITKRTVKKDDNKQDLYR